MKPPVVIIGAGLAGLAAARYLRLHDIPFVLFEASSNIGGLARSHVDEQGFVYDFGAHFINNRLAATLGISSECLNVSYYGESVLVGGKVYQYPLGLMQIGRYLRDGLKAAVKNVLSPQPAVDADASFRSRFGDSLSEEVALPLLEGWSGVPAFELSAAVAAKLKHGVLSTLYLKLLSSMLHRSIAIGYSHELDEGSNVWHVYPLGGIAMACERLAREVHSSIQLESPVRQIFVEQGRACGVLVNGRLTEASAVVSTAPAPVLAQIVHGDSRLDPVRSFTFRPMVFVNLRYAQRPVLPDTVLWVPGSGYPFFRLTETTRSMPWLAPEGSTIITCDIGDQVGGPFWKMADEELGTLCDRAVTELFPAVKTKYEGCRVLRVPNAYPVFLKSYEPERQAFERATGIPGLYSIGRNGEFTHSLMEDVYWRTVRKMGHLRNYLEHKEQLAQGPSA